MALLSAFATPPNTAPNQFLPTLQRLGTLLEGQRPDFRALRAALRGWKMWDKDETPRFLAFIGVSLEDRSAIGTSPLLARLGAADDPASAQRLLFTFLLDRNPLLVKTIFDALDSEQEGRIQSTNELYRLVTSYVYPGDHITLPEFKNWIAWMDAVGAIKLVGIRWGLGPVGLERVEDIRQLDVEEILEDEAEGYPSAWDEAAAEPAQGGAVAGAVDAAPASDAAATASAEDMPDMPPEAPVPSAAAVAEAEAELGEALPPEPASAPAAPLAAVPSEADDAADRVVHLPPRATAPRAAGRGRPTVEPSVPPPAPIAPIELAPVFVSVGARLNEDLGDEERAANVDRLRAWWTSYPYRHPHRAADFGLSLEAAADPTAALADLALAALFATRAEGGSAAVMAHSALRASGALEGLRDGAVSLEQALQGAGLLGLVGGDARFLDALPQVVSASLALRAEPLDPDRLGGMGAAHAIARLNTRTFGRAAPLAPFWLVREAVFAGLLPADPFATVAVVPTRTARDTALRLGFLDSPYASSMDDLIAASQRLGAWFDATLDYGAPLDHLPDHLGCRFRCPFAAGCAWDCREKARRGA